MFHNLCLKLKVSNIEIKFFLTYLNGEKGDWSSQPGNIYKDDRKQTVMDSLGNPLYWHNEK